MKTLDPWIIDDALRALAFSDGERGGAVRRRMSGVYVLAAYDTDRKRPCKVFGASTSPHEVWIMDAEGRRLIDHIDYSAEYGAARLSGYQVQEEGEAELEAAIQRANRHTAGGGVQP